jgi:uncharacterized protein (TIGR01777 family)
MRALVTGGTGFIGRALCARLPAPAVLARDPERARAAVPGAAPFAWEAGRDVPAEALAGADAVFHLAGEPIAAGRLGPAQRRRVLESRVAGTRAVVAAIARAEPRPRVLVSASAVGFYGSRGDEPLPESAPAGEGFVADVCRAWEAEARAAAALGVRVVSLRTGIVLGPGGGALARMVTPFKLGVGGRLGSGRQWMPWVHLDDVVGLALHAAATAALSGPLNVAAPTPATNAELTRALGRALHRPAILPVPAAALRLAFGELAGVLLASQRVVPEVALRTGYRFRFEDLDAALRDALGLNGRGAARTP